MKMRNVFSISDILKVSRVSTVTSAQYKYSGMMNTKWLLFQWGVMVTSLLKSIQIMTCCIKGK